MKIKFTKLKTLSGFISIDLGDGAGYKKYPVDEALTNGVPIPDNIDYSKIIVKGDSSVLENLDIMAMSKETSIHIKSLNFCYNKAAYSDSTLYADNMSYIKYNNSKFIEYGDGVIISPECLMDIIVSAIVYQHFSNKRERNLYFKGGNIYNSYGRTIDVKHHKCWFNKSSKFDFMTEEELLLAIKNNTVSDGYTPLHRDTYEENFFCVKYIKDNNTFLIPIGQDIGVGFITYKGFSNNDDNNINSGFSKIEKDSDAYKFLESLKNGLEVYNYNYNDAELLKSTNIKLYIDNIVYDEGNQSYTGTNKDYIYYTIS